MAFGSDPFDEVLSRDAAAPKDAGVTTVDVETVELPPPGAS